MGTVADILNEKRDMEVHSVRPEDTVLAATQEMNKHGIGAVIVVEADGRLAGIFTERDVLRRVVASEKTPSTVTVAEVMTAEVSCCRLDTTNDEARKIFRHRRIRHLPVVNEFGEVLGMISIGDLNAFDTLHQAVTIHYLNEYVYGRA